MPTRVSHLRHARRGFSSANTVVWLPVVIMMSWLALDVALLYRWANRAQAAADAAALAAAARYRDGREAASEDALTAAAGTQGPAGPIAIDVGDGTSGGEDLEFGTWDEDTRSFTADPVDGGEAVRVTVRFAPGHANGAPSMILGRLFTPGGISMTRRSTAVYVPPRHETSMLMTSTLGAGISMRGTSMLSSRGGVSLATTSSDAAQLTSGTRGSVAVLRTAGAIDDLSESQVDGAVEEGAAIPDDPLAAAPLPALDRSAAQPIVLDSSGTTLVAPGVHAGLSAASGTIVLQPGLHQFTGPLVLDAGAQLQLSAATVQLDAGALLAVAGSASVIGTPATTVPGWEGVAIMTRGSGALALEGASMLDVDGMCYAPQSDVELSGASTLRAQSVIARSMALSDTATIILNGDIEALEADPVPGRARLVR